MLSKLTLEDFNHFVEQNFEMSLEDKTFQMKLVKATLAKHQPFEDEDRRKAFSLFFEPLDDCQYPQANYLISHPNFEEPLSIFMTSVIGNKVGTYLMQAVFN